MADHAGDLCPRHSRHSHSSSVCFQWVGAADPRSRKIVGKPRKPPDTTEKLNGSKIYAIDSKLQNMLCTAIKDCRQAQKPGASQGVGADNSRSEDNTHTNRMIFRSTS
jgi:hypothetical protein